VEGVRVFHDAPIMHSPSALRTPYLLVELKRKLKLPVKTSPACWRNPSERPLRAGVKWGFPFLSAPGRLALGFAKHHLHTACLPKPGVRHERTAEGSYSRGNFPPPTVAPGFGMYAYVFATHTNESFVKGAANGKETKSRDEPRHRRKWHCR
jgi:hypothetical protein